jgi:DNA-binding response OmpR family regulator
MFVFNHVMQVHCFSGQARSGEIAAILYAGADRDLCELLPVLLGEEDWCVRCVNSAAEALNAAAEYPFDLYLLDSWYLDDGLRGVDLCLRLRQTDPSTPILFYSADAFRQHIEEALAAGAEGYVVQPDVEDVLARRISDLLVAASSRARKARADALSVTVHDLEAACPERRQRACLPAGNDLGRASLSASDLLKRHARSS